MKYILSLGLAAAALCGTYKANAQGMAVNTSGNAANSSAMLDVSSTTQGVLVPRMLSTQRTAITGVQGLLVYQTDAPAGFYYYDGGWISLSTSASSTNASNLSSGTVAAARGGAGTVNGILKADGAGNVSAASAGTDYLTSSSSLDATKLSGTLPALDGSALTNLPAGGGGGLTYGGTLAANAVISTTASIMYLVPDASSVTLPAATTAGQMIYLVNTVTTNSNTGITALSGAGDSINNCVNGATAITSTNSFYVLLFISDGNHHWMLVDAH